MDLQWLVDLSGEVDTFMYTYILIALLVVSGIWWTVRTKLVQLRLVPDMLKAITEQKYNKGSSTASSFQALMISTASRVGTGNIAGVSTAIAFGGPGALFWMWAMATVGAASAFVESTLAQIWKVKNEDGSFRGGPAYYIQQGLGKRWLGIVFSVALIICFAYGFNALQAYNASSTLEMYIPDYFSSTAVIGVALVLAAFTAICLFGGGNLISRLTSIIVPFMAIAYLAIALFTTITHIGQVPAVFGLIFSTAFDFRSFAGGFAGSVLAWGIKRGLYSNEAGMGSAPNAAAAASVSHPVKQGLVQTLSVFIDTMVICTCTGMMILVFYVGSGLETAVDPVTNVTHFINPVTGSVLAGMPLVQEALRYSLGDFGVNFITFAIFLFAFSSLLGNYYYAESNIRFIKDNKIVVLIFRITCVLTVFWGAQAGFDLVWNFADIAMGFQAFVNLIALFLLGGWAIKALDDYLVQRKKGVNPVFLASSIPGLPATECWHETAAELAVDAAAPGLAEEAKLSHQVEEMLHLQ